jgi:probable rRNA maturation factor
MQINVLIDEVYQGCPLESWVQSIAEHVLTNQKSGSDTELGLVITGQEKIRELNRNYRGKDESTDVLSFCLSSTDDKLGIDDVPFIVAPDGIRHLGEVIISYPQAVIQASQHWHSVEKEMAILIIHGVLHLLGYDHEEPEQELQMNAREAEILGNIEQEMDLNAI